MDKIRIAICDDMKFICDYFAMLLKENERFEIIGDAQSHDEVLKLAKEKHPDVMLLDLNFDTANSGLALIPKVKEVNPDGKIIIITVHDQGNLILGAISNGADNYLLKDITADKLVEAIIDTYEDKISISNKLLRNVVDEANKIQRRQQSLLFVMTNLSSLSPREYEVLQQLYLGKTYSEIADFLVIEKVTVRSYVSGILKKMGYSNSKSMIYDLTQLEIFENVSLMKNHNNK